MFRIPSEPSSGSTEPYLTEITRYVSQTFIVCFVGVWQRNFEPMACVYCATGHEDTITTKFLTVAPNLRHECKTFPHVYNPPQNFALKE
jgi:hypothetical protein